MGGEKTVNKCECVCVCVRERERERRRVGGYRGVNANLRIARAIYRTTNERGRNEGGIEEEEDASQTHVPRHTTTTFTLIDNI